MRLMMHTDKPLFKALNVTLLYAMLLNSFAPTAYAATATNSILGGARGRITPVFSMPSSVEQPIAVEPLADKPTENRAIASEQPTDQAAVVKNPEAGMVSLAVTAGPGQGESSGFSLGSTDNMVDKFTGDFSYSIPLADVEGYPIVLNYSSNIGMNSEASWVGLGWDLNVGSVSREMRGLPDEFNGEQTINRTFNQYKDSTKGFKAGVFASIGKEYKSGFKYVPSAQITALWGKYNNTYIGWGKTFDFGLGASISIGGNDKGLFVEPSFGIGYTSDSKRGIGFNHNMGISAGLESATNNRVSTGFTFGRSFNSRAGITARTTGFDISAEYNTPESFKTQGRASGGYGASSTVTYGTATSVPAVRFNAYSVERTTGLRGYYGVKKGAYQFRAGVITNFNNTLENTTALGPNQQVKQPALGYFHSGKRQAYQAIGSPMGMVLPLMDFNRSNDYEFSQNMVNLPFSIQTYDIFRANAMGLGATFRGRRQDVGTYYDPTTTNHSDLTGTSTTAGVITEKVGVSIIPTVELSLSGSDGKADVTSGNMTLSSGSNAVEFEQEAAGNNFDAKVYFKGVGELTPESMTDFDAMGATEPTRFEVAESDGKNVFLTSTMYGKNTFSSVINSGTINQNQELVRATFYEPFTAEQYAAKESQYKSYPYNTFTGMSTTPINRVGVGSSNESNAENHLSAVEVTNTSGTRYVFGIPAYDLLSSQTSFCISGLTGSNGVVTYGSTDNTINNSRGLSHYFDQTDVPAYPHSFLLTEMLSSDYIDRTNDGPTLDDIGNFYKFNYTRVYSATNPYHWKYPMGANKALINQGMLGTELDDIAHYSSGKKEIWYTHSVESRNMVAEFYLSDRKDGYGVDPTTGALNSSLPLKQLDSIRVYNLSERIAKGANAVPLQIIAFEYSYELCKELPSNINGTGAASGKLTLKKIRSYSGSSTEMGLYTYEFTYDATNNPNFSYNNSDAWGNYKLSDPARPNDLFPYPSQNQTDADAAAKAWRLIKIQTPTNGVLEIEYEADSYATVQDKRVMKHIDVKGLTNLADLEEIQSNTTWNGSTRVYTSFHSNLSSYSIPDLMPSEFYFAQFGGRLEKKQVPNNVIVFKLDGKIAAPDKVTADSVLKADYFTDMVTNTVLDELLVKLHVDVKGTIKELVPTFSRITNKWSATPVIGVMPEASPGAGYEYGYVVVDPALVEEESNSPQAFNSLQKSVLEFIRRNLPDKLYGTCSTCTANPLLDQAVALDHVDINKAMNALGWGTQIITDYSSVRLYIASNKKYGGGSRVSSLTYKDNWQAISTEYDGVYTWRYEYPSRDAAMGNASFEPGGMIDECPLYRWDTYMNVVKGLPDETKFTPTPVTGLLFPTPVVGYERVKVSISGTPNLGYSITEFHTSRTHPVIENKTAIDKASETHRPKNVLAGKTTDRYGLSQGFFIHTNDFHGKAHQSMIYDVDEAENAQPVLQSRSTYRYAESDATVQMADRKGIITDERVSLEYDLHADSRYIENTFDYMDLGVSFRLKFIPGVPLVVVPYILPTFSLSSRTEAFYSNAFVKHLNTSAIVTAIETESFGSVNSAENIVYDRFSGNVILSSLLDEYNDTLYSLSYPAHWGYHELRDISGTKTNPTVSVTITSGMIGSGTGPSPYNELSPGDEVRVTTIGGTPPKVWVAKRNAGTPQQTLYLMQADGTTYTGATGIHTIQILSTNRDNRLNETMQSLVTKKLPLTTTGALAILQAPTEILSASAVTYRDRNNFKCGNADRDDSPDKDGEVAIGQTVNPYRFGVRGDLIIDAQYAWQSERVNSSHAYKTRFDGTFTDYMPFYRWAIDLHHQQWVRIFHTSHPNYTAHNAAGGSEWRKLGETLVFDQFGKLLETKDQIEVRSAVLYGYDHLFRLVPIAQAVNARQQEIAFDGFEDYSYHSNTSAGITNTDPHFNFKGVSHASVSTTVRHSGLYSLRVDLSETASRSKNAANSCDISSKSDPTVNSFTVDSCSCIKDFEPTPGDYVIGAWVYNFDPTVASNGQVQVAVTGQPTQTFSPSGPVIDGWQRLEGTFTVTAGATVTVSLKNQSALLYAYFDDLRIHPLIAGMTTTVYDPKTLLPLATHDGYNFTTFYNYDENLNLVRMRVETVEGIKTVSEAETGGVKQPKP